MLKDGKVIIDAIIVYDDVAFGLYSTFPAEKAEQFQPVVEEIIDSIKME